MKIIDSLLPGVSKRMENVFASGLLSAKGESEDAMRK